MCQQTTIKNIFLKVVLTWLSYVCLYRPISANKRLNLFKMEEKIKMEEKEGERR
jgi:hypothetical protein